MKNERILIFGDSYSTYEGYIPEGFDAYYPALDVDDVSKTWWHSLLSETESEMVLNNSWSGSTICNTGYHGDCSETSSFIHRLEVLRDSGFFENNQIDRVLVLGATNDSWSKNALGEIRLSEISKEELFKVLPGISFFTARLAEIFPKEKIHFILNTQEISADIISGMKTLCEHYGISYTVLSEIEMQGGHPTASGMRRIKEQVLGALK